MRVASSEQNSAPPWGSRIQLPSWASRCASSSWRSLVRRWRVMALAIAWARLRAVASEVAHHAGDAEAGTHRADVGGAPLLRRLERNLRAVHRQPDREARLRFLSVDLDAPARAREPAGVAGLLERPAHLGYGGDVA